MSQAEPFGAVKLQSLEQCVRGCSNCSVNGQSNVLHGNWLIAELIFAIVFTFKD